MFTMHNSQPSFKDRHPFENRKREADRIRLKYPERIPIIAEMVPKSNLPPLDRCKYLVPSDFSCGQMIHIIRKRINLTPEQAVFIFINSTIPPTSAPMSQLYKEHKEDDGFLYILISGEQTFGE